MTRRPWTREDDLFLVDHYPHKPTAWIADQLHRTLVAVYARAKGRGLKKSEAFHASPASGRLDGIRGGSTRFQKGQVPWCAGKKLGTRGRSGETQFPKGNRPHTWVPIGSYRITTDGVLDRKVTDDGPAYKHWAPVHRLVWEAAHGPIPSTHVVAFLPGRRSTVLEQITVDALELITKQELMRRNTIQRYPPELRITMQVLGKVRKAIERRTT